MNPSFYAAALAEAAAGAPQATEQQLLDVDGTVFVMLALFLICAYLMTQWLWKPYLRVRSERSGRVEGFRAEAARLEAEAAARLQRIEAQLADARRAGSAELQRGRAEAQAQEQRIVSEAQAAAQKTLGEARAKLEAALAGERASLEERAAAIGREIAERVLGRKVAS